MKFKREINPKTGLPYKTTPEQRLYAREYRKKIFTDPVLHEKHRLYRYNKWRNDPKEKKRIREYMRRYNLSPKRIYKILKYNAEKRNMSIYFTEKVFIFWWENHSDICFYCKRASEEIIQDNKKRYISRFTVDRIDNNKGYEIDNIAKCCWLCNRVKGNDFTKKEMLKLGQVINEIQHCKGIKLSE